MEKRRKIRKILMWALISTLIAGLVYAGANLLLQSDKAVSDAGSSGADMEMASLDTIKQSKSNPVNWKQERSLYKKIQRIDAEYSKLAKKAQSEKAANGGKVSSATQKAGLACAKRFQDANENYAVFWEKNNGKTRARLAREAGLTRVKNAEMVFFELDSERISAYNDQQDALAEARSEYLEEAKTDVSDADREALKGKLTPRLVKLSGEVTSLIGQITSLLNQVRSAAGGDVVAIAGCAKQVVSTGSSGGPGALLSPLMSLLNMTKSLGSNVTGLMDDISSL